MNYGSRCAGGKVEDLDYECQKEKIDAAANSLFFECSNKNQQQFFLFDSVIMRGRASNSEL